MSEARWWQTRTVYVNKHTRCFTPHMFIRSRCFHSHDVAIFAAGSALRVDVVAKRAGRLPLFGASSLRHKEYSKCLCKHQNWMRMCVHIFPISFSSIIAPPRVLAMDLGFNVMSNSHWKARFEHLCIESGTKQQYYWNRWRKARRAKLMCRVYKVPHKCQLYISFSI